MMPKWPQGQKRPADMVGNAIKVMRIATGEEDEDFEDDSKNPAVKVQSVRYGKAGAKILTPDLSIAQPTGANSKRPLETRLCPV